MAKLTGHTLFFTTSPRSPFKMIPEIELLGKLFTGQKWNKTTQCAFMDALAETEFFEGKGSSGYKDFSARDRINRGPKALGFVQLKPYIALTEAGEALVSGKRLGEIMLRQMLKHQFPSPYYEEVNTNPTHFWVKPYLEVFRLIHDLGYLTFDELKIFGMQLVDYNLYPTIKEKILKFRSDRSSYHGSYKQYVNAVFQKEMETVFEGDILTGRTQTRESRDMSVSNYVRTKQSNLRDYTDACFRYLRSTGCIDVSSRNFSISIAPDKMRDVEYFLDHEDRNPIVFPDEASFVDYMSSLKVPTLYDDDREVLEEAIKSMGCTRKDLASLGILELKILRDSLVEDKKRSNIEGQIAKLKLYKEYDDILDMFDQINANALYDAPLMFEWNTWRAMTMIDGGDIEGNFNRDDHGMPLSTASGNMPDIFCRYEDFDLTVEVTLQTGQRQFESEGESVARHAGRMRTASGRPTYCLFIAGKLSPATISQFYVLNQMDVAFYGGKSQIIPIDIETFIKLISNTKGGKTKPISQNIRDFLDAAIASINQSANEQAWQESIKSLASAWMLPSSGGASGTICAA